MTELPLLLIVLFMVAGFAYLGRLDQSGASGHWAAAWVLLYGAWLASRAGGPDAAAWLAASHFLGSLFVAALLAGAFAFDQRRIPAWVYGLGFVVGGVRAGARLIDQPAWPPLAGLPIEFVFLTLAGWLVWRGRREGARVEGLLAVALGALAVVNSLDQLARATHSDPLALVPHYMTAAAGTGLLQLVVLLERLRHRERRLLFEGELLRRIALAAADTHGADAAMRRTARAVAGHGAFAAFAIFARVEGEADLVRCAATPDDATWPERLGPNDRLLERGAFPHAEAGLPTPRPRRPLLGSPPETASDRTSVAPLRVGEREVGVAIARSSDARAVASDRVLLRRVAEVTGLVLDHARSVEERAAQARELEALIESVPVGIILVDRAGLIRMLNRVSAEQAGVGDAKSLWGAHARRVLDAFLDRLAPESRVLLSAQIAALSETTDRPLPELELVTNDTPVRTFVVSAQPVSSLADEWLGRLWVCREVTEERGLAERLQRAQRLETLGTLAGGVAHDFNNQLTTILGNAHLLLAHFTESAELREPLADLEESAAHCAELTRSLLAFARQTPPVLQLVDPEAVLHTLASEHEGQMRPGQTLEISVAEGLPAVHADPDQLQRALSNLIQNALDAVADGGNLRLSARRMRQRSPVAGECVEFSVEDDGLGMDRATRDRAFDPFFTTKPVGSGTGLGLAVVYGIVESHGGAVELQSERGRGTCVRLYWPVDPPRVHV
ncbi:MAG: ATP-binding protein [Proteobacteria bacterium]|nr:ATP-binding protein [Pseudomonadota bacterium]